MEKILIVLPLCLLLYGIFFNSSHFVEPFSALPLLALLVYRGIRYTHFPVIGLFETLSFYSFSILALAAVFAHNQKLRTWLRIYTALLLAAALSTGSGVSPFLPDSLNTVLFPLHVAFSFISYAFITIAFFMTLSNGSEKEINEMNYFGFVAFTIGLWTGGIWGYKAWGAYFLFSIKEIFSFTLWIYYAGLIHAKFFRERQRLLKFGTAFGFMLVLFTYIGIGIFMKNTHSLG